MTHLPSAASRGAQRARTSFLALIAVCAAFTLQPAFAAEQTAALAPKPFAARDATRFSDKPDLAPYGLPAITVVYEDSLWPAGASHAQPDVNYIRNNYVPKIRNKNLDVLVIDIEAWTFTASLTAAQVSENIVKYKKVLEVFRQEIPNTKLGLYLVMPERNWLAPCGDPKKSVSRTASWHNRNVRLQPLADAVDIIFPSLYALYDDAKSVACWPTYAKANIAEARMYGKPVWPFLWMKIHTNGNLVAPDFWRKQLETVYAEADGLAIWSMASARDPWSFTAPWWLQTVAFLQDVQNGAVDDGGTPPAPTKAQTKRVYPTKLGPIE